MLRILFWNLNRKDLRQPVCKVVAEMSVDVVVLLENSVEPSSVLETLKTEISRDFFQPRAVVGRFQLFSRNPEFDLHEIHGDNRISLRRLTREGNPLTLGLVHIVDKRNTDVANQAAQVQLLAERIRQIECREKHQRTILIGDFNMNPFDSAMTNGTGLNAMMTQDCVKRGRRKVQDHEYPFFYNPMWNCFGDRTPGPPGTYYHTGSMHGTYGWNLPDQVLIRPDALDSFDKVEILEKAGDVSLGTQRRRPRKSDFSDHFPIVLELV